MEMEKRLNMWQRTMLLTGATLGAEIAAPSPRCRAFVYVSGYSVDPAKHGRPSRFLNADHSDLRYRVRDFEIDEELSRSFYVDKAFAERTLRIRDGLITIEELEDDLGNYLADFTALIDYAQLDY